MILSYTTELNGRNRVSRDSSGSTPHGSPDGYLAIEGCLGCY